MSSLSPEQQQALMQQLAQQIQQSQIDAWNQDLTGGASTQQGALQAVQGIQNLGGTVTPNPTYGIYSNGNLAVTPLSLPSAPQPNIGPGSPTAAASRALGNTVTAGQVDSLAGLPGLGGTPTGPTFGTNPIGGMSPTDYNSAVTAMMGGTPQGTQATTSFTRPLPTAGQPAPTSPGVGQMAQTAPTTAQQITGAPPAWQTPTLGGPATTGVAPVAPATPPAQTGGFTPADQSQGLTYTSAPGNFPTGTPMVPNNFDPAFLANYGAATGGAMNAIGNAYANAPWGTMNAAQMNTGAVPQVNAQTPQSFAALQFLLSGQGFDPATLARMRAQATDTVSQSAAGTMDAARLAAERAGLLNSGLGIGLQANVANQAGIQNQQALNQIAIQNAMQGIQNLTTGTGMNIGLQENAAQQANQVALQNAANLFSSMTQNLANQQASNAANFAGQQQRALGQAQAQSGYATGAGQNLQNAMTNQFYGANVNNANIANQQWLGSVNALGPGAFGGNPYGSTGANASNAGNTTANTTLGNTLLGYGATQKPIGG